MTEHDSDKHFLAQIKSTLDQSAENLDAATRARLTRARRAALEKRASFRFTSRPWFRVAAAGLAMAGLVWMVTLFQNRPADHLFAEAAIEDVDIITSGDSLDLLTDLEFYTWLAEKKENAG